MMQRAWVLIILAAWLSGCSTLEPVEMPAEDLQRMILDGELSLEGESVRLVTRDGRTHKYRVTEVDEDARLIRGKDAAVSVNDVVAIETREFSLGKTALLAGGSYAILGLLALALGPALVL